MDRDLGSIRREFTKHALKINDLHTNPVEQFHQWMEEALTAKVNEPNAMVLATASAQGIPSARTVLLKQYNAEGFTFFTNYKSKKAQEIEENPHGFLLFYWSELERQIRITGNIARVQKELSDRYFRERPEESRIGAWASPQSQPIPNRTYLENLVEDYKRIFEKKEIKRPDYWGGYRVKPTRFEFWQGRPSRLHDRIEYYLEDRIWKIHRLAP
ncbi:MAG: pyridoxamine 5'-phosphate oxidase [Bacteroidota bacterium]